MRSRLGVRLAEARMTNRELARRLGVDENTVGRWKTDGGVGSLTLRRAAEAARVLGCSVADLFDDGPAPDGR